jgi:outer membrane protein OmpA-like peptidoglycan-associated protein
MPRATLLISLLLGLVAATAMAQEVREYRAGDTVDPREVAGILGRQAAATGPAIKMRSIRLLDGSAAQAQDLAVATEPAAAVGSGTDAARQTAALSLPVQFAFDSADIAPSARQQLDALAEGIRLLPQGKAVVIEGHTDAAGTEQYNEHLSQRRAHAVRRYLVTVQGIDPARLRAVGMGEHMPLPGSDPYAARNRRVQFRGE